MKITNSIVLALAGALAIPGALNAQNTNDDAPKATHSLAFANGSKIEVSYQQLRLAGGQSLKNLMSKDARGEQFRQFYNTQYLPKWLNGKLRFAKPVAISGKTLAAGSYGFTFRIDNELVWHFVVTKGDEEVCAVPLEAEKDRIAMAKRLVVEPIAKANDKAAGYFDIRYGPLYCKLAFEPGAAGGSDGKSNAAEATSKKKKDEKKKDRPK